jgi:hypothetical protein
VSKTLLLFATCLCVFGSHVSAQQKSQATKKTHVDLSTTTLTQADFRELPPAEREAYLAGLRDGMKGVALEFAYAGLNNAHSTMSGLVHCAQFSAEEGTAALKAADAQIKTKFQTKPEFGATPMLTIVSLSVLNCAAQEGSTQSASPSLSGNLQPLIAFSGDADKSTARFAVERTEWRVRWRAHPKGSADGRLTIRVMSASGDTVASFHTPDTGGEDVYYVRAPIGDFYLDISCLYMEYVITVEQ